MLWLMWLVAIAVAQDLPGTDVQVVRAPVGSDWVYQDSPPTPGWSSRWVVGWARDPLYITRFNGEEYPIIRDLIHLDAAVNRTLGPGYVHIDVPLRAVYEGPVGVGDPRVSLGIADEHGGVGAWATLPVGTLGPPMGGAGMAVGATMSYRVPGVSASVGATYRDSDLDPWWGISATGTLGVAWKNWTGELRSEMYPDRMPTEASMGYRWHHGRATWTPTVSMAVVQAVAAPKFRVMLSMHLDPRPPRVAVSPVIAVPELPPAPVVQPAAPLEKAKAQPGDIISPKTYQGLRSVAGVLSIHPEVVRVRLEVHTDCAGTRAQQLARSERTAQQVRDFVLAQGITDDRIEVMPMGANEPVVACPEPTPEDAAKNRRVEAVVIEVR